MTIKDTIAFMKSLAPNLSTSTLEAVFAKNHRKAQDDFHVAESITAKANAEVMFKELSKRYIQEVREMGFRTILR